MNPPTSGAVVRFNEDLNYLNTKFIVSDHKFAIENENDGRLGVILETKTCPRCFCYLWLEGVFDGQAGNIAMYPDSQVPTSEQTKNLAGNLSCNGEQWGEEGRVEAC